MSTPAFVWFSDDDNEILGDDICSKCREEMPEDECPIQLFREHEGKTYIARFHHDCFSQLVNDGVIELTPIKNQK